jgi:hypothetical protein
MDRPVPLVAVSSGGRAAAGCGGRVSAIGGRTAPGARAASAATSTAPERSGLVLVWLVLVAAVVNLKRSVAKVGLPDLGKVAVANGCVLVHPPRPPVDASIGLAAQLRPSRGSCRGVVEAP